MPTDSAGLRRFLGMVGFYRRMMPHFAEVVYPLTELIKRQPKSKHLTWTETELAAFTAVKEALQNACTVRHHLPSCNEYHLVTDCSQVAAGAALHQIVDGQPLPVAFFSKKLTEQQRRYSTYDRELLAAYLAVLHFRHLLEGRHVVLYTDHRPLVTAFLSPHTAKSDRQQRHWCVVTEYVAAVEYVRGADNVVADCLSRPVEATTANQATVTTENAAPPSVSSLTVTPSRTVADSEKLASAAPSPAIEPLAAAAPPGAAPSTPVNAVTVDAVDLQAISEAQQDDQETAAFSDKLKPFPLSANFSVLCDVNMTHPRPFVPFSMRQQIFQRLHNLAHPGVEASVRLVKSRYFWPDMDRCIRQWVRECAPCQTSKVHRHTKTAHSSFGSLSDRFETVHVDIVGPLPPSTSHGQSFSSPFRYLLTCIDCVTRWVEAAPLADISAASVASAFVDVWVSRFGVPLNVITDRGTQFESALFGHLAEILGFHRLRTTAYHPKSNGMVERVHRTIKTAITASRRQWLQALPVVLLSVRATPNESGLSPFSAVTGGLLLHPRVMVDRQPPTASRNSDTVRDLAERMSRVDFPSLSTGSDHSSTHPYRSPDLQSCTHVWLRVDRVRRPLEAPYVGPLRVLERAERCFRLEFPSGRCDTVSVERLKPAYMPPPADALPAPITLPVSPGAQPAAPAEAKPYATVGDSKPHAISDDAPVASPHRGQRAQVLPHASDSVPPDPVTTRAGRRVRFRVPPAQLFLVTLRS